ncbi:MAG: hypothetical protein NUK62_00045 [Tenericutes bacterium]|nr:hypothetical protein [Mycoplasmatota bacterium]
MKKVFFLVALFSLLFLQSCQEEVIPTLQCGTNEENINGVCEIILQPEELALVNAIANADDISNYQMDITIQNGHDLYDMIIQFDSEKSSFEFDGQVEYYEQQGGTLYHYIPQGELYVKETVTTTGSNEYEFFKSFEVDWFTYNNGKYLMNLQNQSQAQLFFNDSFPDSELTGFEMTIENDFISEMVFLLQVGEISYRFVIEFSNIGTIDIVLPQV